MKKSPWKWLLVAIILTSLTGLFAVGCGTIRAAYKTAPYKVVRCDGKFELREYPALVLAETPMRGADDSFMRLFRFIGGKNAAQEKIPMTTPVYFTGDTTNANMAFVMPASMLATNTPKPSDPLVTVRETGGGTFAVLRFSGGRNAETQLVALEKLRAWMKQEKIEANGGPIYGYFDPPWTPSFFRRNEVMLPFSARP